LLAVIDFFPKKLFYEQASKFILAHSKFVKEADIFNLKGDSVTMMNLYKITAIHYITQQALNVGQRAESKKKRKQKTDDDYGSDFTDYSDEDFKDLMSN